MILRHLRYFSTVAEEGSVARAARKLRLAQPALSRQIHSLETVIGAPLFDRASRGVTVTPAGGAVLTSASRLVASLEETLRRTRLAHEGRLGRLRLGLGRSAVNSKRIGRALAAVLEQFPEVEVAVSEVPAYAQARAILERELDVGIAIHGSAEDPALDHVILYEDPIDCALLPASHRLSTERVLELRQLRDEKLIIIDPQVTRAAPEIFEALRRHGLTWEPHETVESVYAQIASGRGWVPTPHSYLESPPDGTVVIPIRDFRIDGVIALRWRRTDESQLVANVVATMREAAGDCPAVRSGPGAVTPLEPRPAPLPSGLALRHLRALTVVAEEQSLSRAARRLNLSHSGLSRQVTALERAIGIPILQRSAQGVTTTPGGEELRQGAVTALSMLEALLRDARRAGRGVAGLCTIGAIPSEVAGEALLVPLKQIAEQHPTITIELREMLSSSQIPALRAGEIDVGISTAFEGIDEDPSIESVRLFSDPLECALLSASHPLSGRAWLRPSDLEDLPLVLPSRDVFPKLHDALMQAFSHIGLAPVMDGAFEGPRAIWRVVADSAGWTIGTRAMRAKPPAGTVAVPIEGLHMPAGVRLMWRRAEQNPDVRTVLEAFRMTSFAELV